MKRQRTTTPRVSKRQREVLRIIDEFRCDSWSEVWTHYDASGPEHTDLDFRNFDRVTDALVRKGLVDMDGYDLVGLTEAGRLLAS